MTNTLNFLSSNGFSLLFLIVNIIMLGYMYIILRTVRKENVELKKVLEENIKLLSTHADTIKDINKKICKLKRDNGVIL